MAPAAKPNRERPLLRDVTRRRATTGTIEHPEGSRAGATEHSQLGEINLGQLIRKNHQNQAFLIGFTTYRGTVTAASHWDGPAERKAVRPALPRSYEALLHAVSSDRFQLDLRHADEMMCRGGSWSARSESSIAPRRNASAIISTLISPRSSMQFCMSMKPALSSRWNAPGIGPRRTRGNLSVRRLEDPLQAGGVVSTQLARHSE